MTTRQLWAVIGGLVAIVFILAGALAFMAGRQSVESPQRPAVQAVTPAVQAEPNPITRIDDPERLVDLYFDADEGCRGGSGDLKSTMAACEEREQASKRLEELGWCYKPYKWNRCP